MTPKVYYLSSCDTCKRIIRDFQLKERGFQFQDVKTERVNPEQLDKLKELSGSYEALFNKQCRKYKEMNLSSMKLPEAKIRDLILTEYTFLKRPVILIGDQIFAGNSKQNLENLKNYLIKI